MQSQDRPHTHIKSFFAASVQAAIEQARQEMGAEALLLDTRDAPPEARHLGDFEVIFGSRYEPPPSPLPAKSGAGRSTASLDELQRRLEEIAGMLGRVLPTPPWQRGNSPLVVKSLIEAGIEPALASEIEDAVRQRIMRQPVACIEEARKAATDPSVL